MNNFRALYLKTALAFAFTSISASACLADDGLDEERRLSALYMAGMASETGALTIDEGVVIRPIFQSESNTFPTIEDEVRVIYHLVDRDDTLIEESLTTDMAVVFPLNKLIKCWKISLPKIQVGSVYKVSCPSDSAYGDKGTPDGAIKPAMALTFRIMLLGITAPEAAKGETH